MPIYDYRCDACGHAFSAVRSYSDGPVEECPNCGKRPRKLLVAPAVVFKGSGWYKTDSRGAAPKESGDTGKSSEKSSDKSDKAKSDKAGTKSDAKAESTSDTKSETKSDSKPAGEGSTKSEAKS